MSLIYFWHTLWECTRMCKMCKQCRSHKRHRKLRSFKSASLFKPPTCTASQTDQIFAFSDFHPLMQRLTDICFGFNAACSALVFKNLITVFKAPLSCSQSSWTSQPVVVVVSGAALVIFRLGRLDFNPTMALILVTDCILDRMHVITMTMMMMVRRRRSSS